MAGAGAGIGAGAGAGAGVVSLGPDIAFLDLMPNDPVQTRRLRPIRSILRVEQRELRFRQMPLIPIRGAPLASGVDGRDYIRGGLQPHISEHTRAILLHWMQEVYYIFSLMKFNLNSLFYMYTVNTDSPEHTAILL